MLENSFETLKDKKAKQEKNIEDLINKILNNRGLFSETVQPTGGRKNETKQIAPQLARRKSNKWSRRITQFYKHQTCVWK